MQTKHERHAASSHQGGDVAATVPPGVRVSDVSADIGVEEARRRFGGLDVPATLAGTSAAVGLAVVVAGLFTAGGSFGYQRGLRGSTSAVSIGGFVAGLVTLALAFLFGGWVAGRMARYDGGRNGLLVVVWFVVLAALLGAIGAWAGSDYDVFEGVHLPQWFS